MDELSEKAAIAKSHLSEIEKLPMSEQKALIKTIDAYLKSAESTE